MSILTLKEVSVFGARINYGSNCKIEEPTLVNE